MPRTYADIRRNNCGGRTAISSPSTENTAKKTNTLDSTTPRACTAANFTKKRKWLCDAETTVGNRMQDAAFTSRATNATRNSTATRFARKMVRVEMGKWTRFM